MLNNALTDIANWRTKRQQLYTVSSPCLDDHHFKKEERESLGELSKACSQIVLKCLYLARIGRPDSLWSVNKLARSVTKWTRACDKRFSRLISYIHHTCEYKQYCYVGNTARQCTLGLFQDSAFAGDLEAPREVRTQRTMYKGQAIPSGALVELNIIRFLHETSQGFINLARNFSSDMH